MRECCSEARWPLSNLTPFWIFFFASVGTHNIQSSTSLIQYGPSILKVWPDTLNHLILFDAESQLKPNLHIVYRQPPCTSVLHTSQFFPRGMLQWQNISTIPLWNTALTVWPLRKCHHLSLIDDLIDTTFGSYHETTITNTDVNCVTSFLLGNTNPH